MLMNWGKWTKNQSVLQPDKSADNIDCVFKEMLEL